MLPTEVTHHPPKAGEKWWTDEWWGPGGHLIVERIDWGLQPNKAKVDAHETLYRPDGTIISEWILLEGEDYHTLPELFGEKLWVEYMSQRHGA